MLPTGSTRGSGASGCERLAAALGRQEPRERPKAAQQRADESHRKFRDEGSDFAGYLKLWAFWQEARARGSRSHLHKVCREHFLSYNRMREWEDIHEQLVRVMKELEIPPNRTPGNAEQIHRALLPGLLSKLGMWNQEARCYIGARQIRFAIHPSSGLARKPPPWIVAAELVETSQLFARTCAKIDPAWLEAAAGPLCRRSHADPHWEQKQGQVMAREQVTLYGLPIVKDRSVAYARFDPALCRELFITHALIRHEYTTKARFMDHNRRVQAEVQRLHDKARTSDMFANEHELWQVFDRRLPPDVVSAKSFEAWRKVAEASDPAVLELSVADLLADDADDISPERFPDRLVVRGATLSLSYKFNPGDDDDGVTVTVPLAVLPQLDPSVMLGTIPGWHATQIAALLDQLPKATRKALAPLDEQARALAAAIPPLSGPLLRDLERAIFERTGERVAPDAWDVRAIPSYLGFTFRVVDERDKVLGQGKDLAELQRQLGARARELWATATTPTSGGGARDRHERKGMTRWDLDVLPASVTIDVGNRKVPAYPALVDTENAVDVRLMESPAAAATATRTGLRRLFLLHTSTSVAHLEAQLPGALPKDRRRVVALRAFDEAYGLIDPEAVPRDRATFQAHLAEGQRRLPRVLAELGKLALEVTAQLSTIQGALAPLRGKPGIARAVVEDVDSQLAYLAPRNLLEATPAARLAHVVRYLKAIVVRLQRQAHDPQKDQTKAAQVSPMWQRYVTKRAELASRSVESRSLEDYRWLVEELRVQVFAPEIKTAAPVSPQRLHDLWALIP